MREHWSSSDITRNAIYNNHNNRGFAIGNGTSVSTWFTFDGTVRRAIDCYNDGSQIVLHQNTGIGKTPATGYKLDVNGVARATDFELSSDRRLKSDIQDLHSIDLLRQLQPKSFYKNEKFGYGFIAQDIQELVPSMVGDSGEYLSLRQTDIIALNTSAIQYLDKGLIDVETKTEKLQRRVQELEEKVRQLGGSV